MNGLCRKHGVKMIGIFLALMVTLALLPMFAMADDYVGGVPLTTVQTGTVTGDLWYDITPAPNWGDHNVTKTFTLPAAAVAQPGRIQWARLYVSAYVGHMQNDYAFTVTNKWDGNGDGVYDLIWPETGHAAFHYQVAQDDGIVGNDNTALGGGANDPYKMINDHENRITSDYLMYYDVTSLIQGQTVNVNVNTEGSYDGRIKVISLVVAYNDPASTTQTTYYVNQGHDVCSYYTEDNYGTAAVGSTTFATTGLTGITSATLAIDYMASNNGNYGFPTSDNTFTYTGGSPPVEGTYTNALDRIADVQGPYSGVDSWNVTSQVTGSSDVNFAYARYFPGTGTAAFYKIPLAILVVKESIAAVPAPVIDFTGSPASGTRPLTVAFTATNTGGAVDTWAWDFGDGGSSADQNPSHQYATSGTYTVKLTAINTGGSDIEEKTGYITVNPNVDFSITGLVNCVPASAIFAREPNTITITNIKNLGTDAASNIVVKVYASDVDSGNTAIATATIASLGAGAQISLTGATALTDPTIRTAEGTVTYTAKVDPDNLIAETNEANNNKNSAAKSVKFNGYKGKRYWDYGSDGLADDIITKQTYDLNGDIVYYTQPDSQYKGVGWTTRTETWTTANLPIPAGATVEKVLLFFSYNWDQTAGGYPNLVTTFNENPISLGTPYRDWSNFGAYADYEYGLYPAYDVTGIFNVNGDNTLVTAPGNSGADNKVALYPSTLVVIYRDASETRKQIFINEEYDYLGFSTASYGTNLAEATAYAPFSGMTIDTAGVQSAKWHSFATNAGPAEGNVFFNGNPLGTNVFTGNTMTADAKVFDVKSLLTATGNEAGIQGTESGGMGAIQQFLVVEYTAAPPVAAFTATARAGLAPLSVQFTDQSTNAGAWAWDFNNDGVVDNTTQNPVNAYASAGTYTVNLTVTGAGGTNTTVKTNYIAVSAGKLPLTTKQSGTVSGGLYVGAYQPVPWSSQPTTPGLKEFTQAYTIPAFTNIQWARLYAVVYAAGTDDRTGIATTSLDGNGDGTYEAALGTETLNIPASGNGYAYWQNDHVNRVYSDYLIWYDVTGIISAQGVNAKIVTQNASGSNFDGRLKSLTLVVAYNNGSSDQVMYWVNDGHDYQGSSDPASQTTFDTTTLTSGWTSATLSNIMLSSKDAAYTFDGQSYTGANPVAPIGTFGYNVWNVTGTVNAGSASTLGYAHASGTSFKTQLATLTVRYVAPVADFSANETSGTAPLTVQFSDLSLNGPTSWNWDFGDGASSTLKDPVHTYNGSGSYTVSLNASNAGGSNVTTKVSYITVNSQALMAVYVSDTIPASMIDGQSYPVSVTFNNTGTLPWTENSQIRLAAWGNNDVFGINGDTIGTTGYAEYMLPAGVTVSPGTSYTWNLTATPSGTGYYWLGFGMIQDGASPVFFGLEAYSFPEVDLGILDAQNVAVNVPVSMVAGQSYPANITFKNTGTATWSESSRIRLAVWGNNDVFGLNGNLTGTSGYAEYTIPASTTVAPGEELTISMTLTPASTGYYWLGFGMVQDGETPLFFSPEAYAFPYVDMGTLNAETTSVDVPSSIVAGQSYPASVTVKNTGTATWTEDSLIRLATWGNNDLFGINGDTTGTTGYAEYTLPSGVTVNPGASYTWNFTVSPTTTGYYWLGFGMIQDGAAPLFFSPEAYAFPYVDLGTLSATNIVVDMPVSMVAGQSYPANITFKNTGTATWSESSRIRLAVWGNNDVFGLNGNLTGTSGYAEYTIPASTTIAPGEEFTVLTTVTPTAAGYYWLGFGMAQDGATPVFFSPEAYTFPAVTN